jgi:D-alanine-D-alanine ligase
MGNDPPIPLPPIEMVFGNDSSVESRIATFKAKWSVKYRESKGIQNEIAKNLSEEVRANLAEVAVRAYQAAGLRDYGRIDVRLAHDGVIYVVEANPNPYLADGEDLAWAAEEGGNQYADFISKIAEMATNRARKARSASRAKSAPDSQ